MIEIKEGGNWYRLAQYGVFFENDKIKSNLCPFMRRATLGLFLTLLLYPFLAVLAIMSLSAPFYHLITCLYFDDWSYFWVEDSFFIIGLAFYFLASIVGVVVISTSHTVQTVWKRTKGVTAKVADSAGLHPVVAWIKAAHEKVCPPISIK